LWPKRSKASDGWIGDTSHAARPSDHNPAPPDGIVRALDITNAGIDVDGLIAAVIRDPRTRYVISRGRIWTRENGWQKYTGANRHDKHVHISVRSVGNYDRDASPWNLAARMGNNIGGGGSVTVPNVPGAPAPITKGFLMALSDAKQDELFSKVNFLYQAMAYGSRANGRTYPSLLDMVVENQVRIGRVPSLVWDTKVQRAGGPVSALQELADAKTAAFALRGENAALKAALDAAGKGQGLTADQIVEAARAGAEEALKGGVKVTIDIPKES